MSLAISSAAAANVAFQPFSSRPSGDSVGQARDAIAQMFGRMDGLSGRAPEAPQAQAAPTRTLVESENALTAGPLGVQDAYDLKLYREPSGDYTLEVHMGLDFNFKSGADASGAALNWTAQEKQAFMADYERTVEEVWDGRTIRTAPDGGEVKLDIRLNAQETMTGENWNVDVKRIGAGEFSTSYVQPGLNRATLDSEDVVKVSKGQGQLQYGSAHEFGHMLGLEDEYNGGAHVADYPSIMNRGSTVEGRHLQDFSDWVSGALR